MLNLLTNHTYTLKLKWSDGSTPSAKGAVAFVGTLSQIAEATLVDPTTLRVVTYATPGVAGVMVQSPDRMSVAVAMLNVSMPQPPAPAVVAFDEATLTQTA